MAALAEPAAQRQQSPDTAIRPPLRRLTADKVKVQEITAAQPDSTILQWLGVDRGDW
jgi:hypothetical protein